MSISITEKKELVQEDCEKGFLQAYLIFLGRQLLYNT